MCVCVWERERERFGVLRPVNQYCYIEGGGGGEKRLKQNRKGLKERKKEERQEEET